MVDQLQIRNTVLFFLAHLFSAFGYEFAFFVMTIHVYGHRGSASDVAIFATLTFLPRLFAPWLGALVDRFSAVDVFAWSLALGAGSAVLVPLVSGERWEMVPWAGLAVLSVLFGIVRTALMTRVLETGGYLQGNSVMLISLNTAKLAAPLVGALAAAWLPFRFSMAAAGACFLLASGSAWSLKLQRPEPRVYRSGGNLFTGFRKGLAELWCCGHLRFVFLLSIAWRLFLGLQIPLLVVFIRKALGRADADYGLFMTCVGMGSLLGSAAGPWIATRTSPASLLKAGIGLHFAGCVMLARMTSFWAAVATGMLAFAALYAAVVGAHAMRDQATPEPLRGRVFGANTALLAIAGMASMLAGGRLADSFGVRNVFLGAGLLSLAFLLTLQVVSQSWRPAPVKPRDAAAAGSPNAASCQEELNRSQ